MAKADNFNLNWPTFDGHLKLMLQHMINSNYLTDVTLFSDDRKQIKAHKVILSACSPVLKEIIDCMSEKEPVIYLKGIQHQELQSILELLTRII